MNLLDLIFPKRCLGCRKEGAYLCKECVSKVPPAYPFHPRFVSIWKYQGVVREALVSLKYKFAKEVAEELGRYAILELKKRFPTLPKKASLLPVPLHWYRQNWRGFNQSSLLGEIIARQMGWQFIPDLLIRKKSTTPQVQLRSHDRRKNVKGVFAVNPRYGLKTMHPVLIFDDVWTTGSTMREVARALKKAGAKEVWGLTITK